MAMRAELQTVLDSLPKMQREKLPELLGELEVIRTTAVMHLSAASATAPHDELLEIESAADRLSMSVDYLYRNAKNLPFTRRMGRKLLFSSLGMDAYISKKRA